MKKTTTDTAAPRDRLSRTSYETGKVLTVVMSNPEIPAARRFEIEQLLTGFALECGFDVCHPSFVQQVFLECCRIYRDAEDGEQKKHQQLARWRLIDAIEDLQRDGLATDAPRVYDDWDAFEARSRAIAEAAMMPPDVAELYEPQETGRTEQGSVVDMLSWIQSRPRPIRQPLFSFPDAPVTGGVQ